MCIFDIWKLEEWGRNFGLIKEQKLLVLTFLLLSNTMKAEQNKKKQKVIKSGHEISPVLSCVKENQKSP